MFSKLGVLVQIAWRNLFATWLNVIIGLVILGGTFLVVVGGSFLDSLDRSMSESVTGSVSGDIQVYSAKSKEDLEIFGGMMGSDSDIAPIPSYEKLEAAIGDVPGVEAVVPMGFKGAMITSGNTIDVMLARLRSAVEKARAEGATDAERAQVESLKQHVRHIVSLLDVQRANANKLITEEAKDPRADEAIARASSEDFWASFDADPFASLEYLENRIAPLLSDGDMLFIRYMGTDLDKFARTFERMQIVDGEMVPTGRRGILIPKFFYEEGFKLKTARRLDKIKEGIEESGKTIAADPELQRFVRENTTQTQDILLQLDPLKTKEATARLQKALGSTEPELEKLLVQLLDTNDANFQARYRIFYDELAPLLELYKLRVGDMLTIKAFTNSGFMENVNVKVWGTFQFKGLEKSPLSGVTALMDLMSFRDLYGYMSAENKQELQALKKSAGIEDVAREDAEAALFGEDSSVVVEGSTEEIDEASLFATDGTSGADSLLERVYTQQEIDQGVVLNAAVIVKDGVDVDQTMALIQERGKAAGLELKTATWQKASGLIGQFVQYLRYALYAIAFVAFLVAMVILSNAVLMATLQRVREIGTMRAIGAQRGFVRAMIVVETLALGIAFGGMGMLLGAGLVAIIGTVGIPAGSQELYFFFGGPRWFPEVSFFNMVVAFLLVLVVSILSTLYPALIATRVSPVTAMSAEE